MERRRQLAVLIITTAYFFIELIGGLYYRSLALVTDASFMAINITGQLVALYVARLSKRAPTRNNTFGYERAKVLSSLFNGILVGFLLFYVFADAFRKISHPVPMDANRVLVIALIGLAVNAYGFLQFYRHASDINLRGALLLLGNDALGSVGVIVSSLIIRQTGLYMLDPLTAVLIALFVAYPTYFLLRDSVHILMEGNPAKAGPEEVERFIYERFPDILRVKDIHIWGLSPERIMLAVRIRTNGSNYNGMAIRKMKQRLVLEYGYSDIYIELYDESFSGATGYHV